MTNRRSVVSGAALLLAGQLSGGVTSFVRNLLVARVLAPADFGIGATFVITTTFLETISNLGMAQMLIQAKDGGQSRLQATAHTIMMIRGVLIGTAIYLAAPLVVRVFEVPEAEWAFKVLALAPVIKGLTHLDIYRLQKQLRYGGAVIADQGANIIVTAAAWPVAKWYGNYVALLWISMATVIIATVLSHLLAERPYRWGLGREYILRFLTFGWPLMLNGALLFGTLQGDRALVGAYYDVAVLGVFSIAAQLASMPVAMVWGVVNRLALPVLSSRQDRRHEFDRLFGSITGLTALLGGSMAIFFVLLGGPLIVTLYGQRYREAGLVVGWLGAAQAMRLMRGVPGLGAMSLGDTKNMLVANVFRSFALLGAVAVVSVGMDVTAVAMCALAGELAGLMGAIGRLRSRHGVRLGLSLRPIAMVAAVISASLGTEHFFLRGSPWYVAGLVTAISIFTYLAVGVVLLTSVRAGLMELSRSYGKRGVSIERGLARAT